MNNKFINIIRKFKTKNDLFLEKIKNINQIFLEKMINNHGKIIFATSLTGTALATSLLNEEKLVDEIAISAGGALTGAVFGFSLPFFYMLSIFSLPYIIIFVSCNQIKKYKR